MKRISKKVVAKVSPTVIDDAMSTYYRDRLGDDTFNNVQEPKVMTLDQLKLAKVDVMKLSLADVIRKLVRAQEPFHVIRLHVYNFYNQTNDRSRTRRPDKEQDLNAYATMRTKKYLRDILKEQFAKDLFHAELSVKDYMTRK